MTKDSKAIWLFRAADVLFCIGDAVEKVARPFHWLGDKLNERGFTLKFKNYADFDER